MTNNNTKLYELRFWDRMNECVSFNGMYSRTFHTEESALQYVRDHEADLLLADVVECDINNEFYVLDTTAYDDVSEYDYEPSGDDCSLEDEGSRYTIIYEGHLFEGDVDGINRHDTDDWNLCSSLITFFGDVISINDNWYGVTFSNGEWF